jgi:hypothetical protein
MLAKAAAIYLAVLFACGVVATLMPRHSATKVAARTQPAVLHVEPFHDDAKARVDHAILRDRLAAPEDRDNDGIESDTRDRMKYRPLSAPMT